MSIVSQVSASTVSTIDGNTLGPGARCKSQRVELPGAASTATKVNSASPGYVATDLNRHSGELTVEQGARVPVYLATLDDDGPSGCFIGETSPLGDAPSW
jgi:hypothetical protein